ncbi:MAG: hemerythrin domain-containing protein [Bacteroidales bacterium]|jgi:regulator of cell morphogenesis and NO signaling|nr:hemerythrin domain-containing protein [Bacteroidales bacterium]
MYKIEIIIGPDTRLAELILDFPGLLDALEQLNIRLGFGEQSIREVADRYRINCDAFMVVVHTYCDCLSPGKTIRKEALGDLLAFLKNSHNGFKKKQIPELKKLIAAFAGEIPEKYGQMLISFFDGYIKEVYDHFEYEDSTVFPYIGAVLENRPTGGFAINEFEKNHTDIEQKLLDLKNILIKYMPEKIESAYRAQILHYLFEFDQQLSCHTKLEDQVLAPSVKKVEKKERHARNPK